MLQNQYFEIMEEIKRNDRADKPAGNSPKPQGRKPVTAASKTTARKLSAAGTTPSKAAASLAKTPVKSIPSRPEAKSPAKPVVQAPDSSPVIPSAEKTEDIIAPVPEKAPGESVHVTGKKSKKMAAAFKKLKVQKREIASLEKNRDRLMKDLISAIEKKKKNKKIRSLARDLNRIDKRVNNRTASYIQANKKLTNKMEKGKS